jgi:hypothetical protein
VIRAETTNLNIGSTKRIAVLRDSNVKPAINNSPDLMTNWKSLVRGSTNTVNSVTYNANFVSLTTKPKNAIENLFYAMFIPSIRQDRYQNNYNTFTLNPTPVVIRAPLGGNVKSAAILRGLPNISYVFDLPKLRAVSKISEPGRFRTQDTLARDTIKIRAAILFQVFYLDDNQGKVRTINKLTDINSKVTVTPVESYTAKLTTLTTRPTNSRGNLFYAEYIPSIRQDRYQNNYNTFTLNPTPVVQSRIRDGNLVKPIEKVRSDNVKLLTSLVNILNIRSRDTQVFNAPGISQLPQQFEKIKSVPDNITVGRTRTVTKLSNDLTKFNQTGKTLLINFVREVSVNINYLSMTKYKVNTDRLQMFYTPVPGMVTKFKSGAYGVGIVDPTYRKQEPIQFWN